MDFRIIVKMCALPTSFSPSQFYGSDYEYLRERCQNMSHSNKYILPYIPRNLVNGPNSTWKVFRKQEDALRCMEIAKGGLMSFAFEHHGPGRMFLVAHPEIFWHYDIQRSPANRQSYEIIPELTACKLYLDLEYDCLLNKSSNGPNMVDIFIRLLILHLQQTYDINCEKSDIINLDSSTPLKFSRHLIFNLPSACFLNNYQAGNFVKFICKNIKNITENAALPDFLQGKITVDELKSLFVVDAKGKWDLFCDEGVYTKNRQFRLYGSTKKGKNSNLVLSEDNTFIASNEAALFLHSLVTHIENCHAKVLEFAGSEEKYKKLRKESLPRNVASSSFPSVDNFISDLISPGKIYRSAYFAKSKVIVYDISGNRFCANIGRAHKSNNVKYIVNLEDGIYYQKCHDPDCYLFKSSKIKLPDCVLPHCSDIIQANCIENCGVFHCVTTEEQTSEIVSENEESCNHEMSKSKNLVKFPSFGLGDENFLHINV